MSSIETTEAMILAKGKTAARVTVDLVKSKIKSEYFHIVPGTTMTICVLKLANGFLVTGESAAASVENFDVEIGQKIARENAVQKIWGLEGYLLRERLYHTQNQLREMKGEVPELQEGELIVKGEIPDSDPSFDS